MELAKEAKQSAMCPIPSAVPLLACGRSRVRRMEEDRFDCQHASGDEAEW